jgi:DNA helicase HerA-like ATPase
MATASQQAAKVVPRIFRVASDEGITIGGIRGYGKTTLAKMLLRKFPRVLVYDPLDQYQGFNRYVPQSDTPEEFAYVANWVWREQNIMFAIEECENYIGEGMAICQAAKNIINRGRNYGIGYMAITRRIANLSKTAFSLSDHVFLFRFFAPNDVRYCSDFIGRDWAARLQELPKHNFLYYGAQGEVCECPPIKVPHV